MVFKKLKRFFFKHVLKRTYYRSGSCSNCGECCKQIYVRHARNVVQTVKEHEKLKLLHPFYTYLKVVGKDEIGLVFECQNVDPITNLCKIHKKRPAICRRYPVEEIFMMGGELGKNCGYKFTPIDSFDEIFSMLDCKNQKKKPKSKD